MNARFRSLSTALLVFAALLLTACELTITPGPPAPEPDITRAATMDPSTPYQITVPANDALLVRVTLDSAAQNDEAIYFEVDGAGDAELVLFTTGGSVLSSSSSADVFFQGTAGLSSSATTASLTPQILTVQSCLGPCIIDDADRSAYLLEVVNTSGFQQTFDLYLYTQAYGDEYEPSNGSTSTAVSLFRGPGNTDEGAIESIGDRDYWAIEESGDLFFDAVMPLPSGLDLRLTVIDDSGTTIGTYQPGTGAIQVLSGDIAIVFENGNNAAAVSGSSQYFLEIQ